MKNFKRFLFLLVLLLSFNLFAQEWVKYSDSILSNLQKNDVHQAESYMLKAEHEIGNFQPTNDSLYAKFLYRKGLVDYFNYQNGENNFLKSLNVWKDIPKKNYVEISEINYFLALTYRDFHKDSLALKTFREVFKIINKKKIKKGNNYKVALYYLAQSEFYQNNLQEAEKYALEYIELTKKNAYDNYDFNYAKAHHFAGNIKKQKQILFQFLENYDKEDKNDHQLLMDIQVQIMMCSSYDEDPVNVVRFGEKALETSEKYSLKSVPLELIHTNLIYGYMGIGDDKNYKKFFNFKSKIVSNQYAFDPWGELQDLILNEEYSKIKDTFKKLENHLISNKDFDALLDAYTHSLALYERNLLFSKDDILSQITFLNSKIDNLSEKSKIDLDFFKAEFFVYTGDFLQTLRLANRHINNKNNKIRLSAYNYKSIAENMLIISSGGKNEKEALRIAVEVYGESSPQILPFILLVLTTDNQNEIQLTAQALQIIEENSLKNSEISAKFGWVLGENALKIGNLKDSEFYFKRAIDIYIQSEEIANPGIYIGALLGMAKTCFLQGKIDKSWRYLQKAREEWNKKEDITYQGDYYEVLGDFYFHQGKYEESKKAYKEAFELYGDKFSKNRKLKFLLSEYFLYQKKDQAVKKLKQFFKDNGDINNILEILYLLLYSEDKDLESRKVLIKSIENSIEKNINFSLNNEYEKELIFQRLLNRFEYLNTHLLSSQSAEFLITYVNLRFYLKSLILTSQQKLEDSAEEFYSEFQENNILINKYYERKKDFTSEIETLLQRNRELEKILSKESQEIYSPKIEDVKGKLMTEEVYVEIIRINKQAKNSKVNQVSEWEKFTDSIYYGALIIKKEKEPKFLLIDSNNKLENEHLVRLQNFSSGKFRDQKDTVSFSKFFEPIYKEIKDKRKIYFVADGIYNSINLEALYIPEKEEYLLEIFNIKRILSARSLFKEVDTTSHDQTAILIGNPDFELPIENSEGSLIAANDADILRSLEDQGLISYLPGTQKEIHNISRILSKASWNTKVFTLTDASEENLKRISSPYILHIATHGYFVDDFEKKSFLPFLNISDVQKNPLLKSGLLLSGSQNTMNGQSLGARENGILMAQEAKSLNLSETDIVVLSACETGLGNFQVGEGVYGLQRAFMMSGAKSVIMSLWQVDDEATNQLMTAFYTNLIEKKMNKHEALISAKKQLKQKYSSPYYWAPFILIE